MTAFAALVCGDLRAGPHTSIFGVRDESNNLLSLTLSSRGGEGTAGSGREGIATSVSARWDARRDPTGLVQAKA
jgi:hypothetical protein